MAKNSNAINYFSPAKWVVSPVPGEGTHVTLSAAFASASAGDTIVIMPGTYSDSGTAVPSVNVYGMSGQQGSPVKLTGTWTFSTAGIYQWDNLYFVGTSVFSVVCSGANLCDVNFTNCFFEAASHNAISNTNSNAASSINFFSTNSNISNASYTLYEKTATGAMTFSNHAFGNTSLSTVPSDNSAGQVVFSSCTGNMMFSTSGVGFYTVNPGSSFYTPQGTTFTLNDNYSDHSVFTNSNINCNQISCIYVGATAKIVVAGMKLKGGKDDNSVYVIEGASGGKVRAILYTTESGVGNKSYKINPVLTTETDTTVIGDLFLETALSALYGGTGLSSPGTAGNVLVSTGTGWQSATTFIAQSINDISTNTNASSNTAYNATAALTLTLPPSPSQSDSIQLICSSAGPIVIKANTGQTIKVGANNSTSAGTATNTQIGDTLTLRYLSASTTWRSVSSTGNWSLA